MATEEDTLEIRLNRATDPSMKEIDMDKVQAFCDRVNCELEGPLISTRLIAHKIQSPQEKEAMYALTTLETCVRCCGRYFHQEIGKFRFLNEIIKVVSPKYLGNRTPVKVKQKCVELLYCWTKGLPHEPKITEAYKMLKSQNIIKDDPVHMDKQIFDPFPPPKPRKADFEDDEKAKTLEKLLRSKHPEDLQAANRLIKNMVKEDAEKSEKRSKRINELESLTNQVNILTEMIAHFSSSSSKADKDMMKELFENLEKQRPNLFRLASDVEESDAKAIEQILNVNDSVTRVMTSYKQTVEGEIPAGDYNQKDSSLLDLELSAANVTPSDSQSSTLLDNDFKNLGLDNMSDLGGVFNNTNTMQQGQQSINNQSNVFNGMGGVAMGGMNHPGMLCQQGNMQPATNMGFAGMPPTYSGISHNIRQSAPSSTNSDVNLLLNSENTPKPALADLDILDKSLQDYKLSKESFPMKPTPTNKMPLNQLAASKTPGTSSSPTPISASNMMGTPLIPQQQSSSMSAGALQDVTSIFGNSINQAMAPTTNNPAVTSSPSTDFSAMVSASPATPAATELLPLTDVFVPLDKIQPDSSIPPVTAYDKNSLKMMIHFVQHRPRPDVITMVVSTISTNSNPISSFVFQSAVPKIMKVKLQPPSATDFPAFNPILPPAAITQVMLVANPRKEKVRLKYKLAYTLDGQSISDVGDIESIPVS